MVSIRRTEHAVQAVGHWQANGHLIITNQSGWCHDQSYGFDGGWGARGAPQCFVAPQLCSVGEFGPQILVLTVIISNNRYGLPQG